MKKFTAFLLALVMCIMAVGCDDGVKTPETSDIVTTTENITTAEDTTNETTDTEESTEEIITTEAPVTEVGTSTPLLYKVTDSDGDVVWLFGSVHVGRDDFYPLPDYVTKAFSRSDALAVELDILAFESDLSAQVNALKHVMYLDGTKISDVLSPELYDAAVDILKENDYYSSMMDYYKPVFWSNLIDTLLYTKIGADGNDGVDRHLLQLAKDVDKKIMEIESGEEQYALLGGFSTDVQLLMLEGSVESYGDLDAAKEELTMLLDLWASGDEEAFGALLSVTIDEEGATPEEIALAEEYVKAMYTDRNQNMADFAEDALKAGDEVFICVGAAHIVGDDALVGIMTDRGYTVERVQ